MLSPLLLLSFIFSECRSRIPIIMRGGCVTAMRVGRLRVITRALEIL